MMESTTAGTEGQKVGSMTMLGKYPLVGTWVCSHREGENELLIWVGGSKVVMTCGAISR
jgi:hypothetical protein